MSASTPLEQASATALAQQQRAVQSKRGPWRDAMRRLVRNRMGMVGLGIIVLFGIAAIFGEAIAPHSPTRQDLFNTSLVTVTSVVIELVLGMGLALVMHRALFARRLAGGPPIAEFPRR